MSTCATYDIPCWITALIDKFVDLISWIWETFVEFLLWFANTIVDGIGIFFNSIPAPDFVANADLSGFPASAMWWADLFMVQYGIAIFLTSAIIRFVIRRITFIN